MCDIFMLRKCVIILSDALHVFKNTVNRFYVQPKNVLFITLCIYKLQEKTLYIIHMIYIILHASYIFY